MAKPLGLFIGTQTWGANSPQQPTSGKFKISSVIGFKPRTMCHLLEPHFLVFALANWATWTSTHDL